MLLNLLQMDYVYLYCCIFKSELFGNLKHETIDSVDKPAQTHLKEPLSAQVAELVDALASGASVRKDVEVRVFSWAPLFPKKTFLCLLVMWSGLKTSQRET